MNRLPSIPASVFDTFPWPQFGFGVPASAGRASDNSKRPESSSVLPPEGGTPNEDALARIRAVAAAAREVRRVRVEALPDLKGGRRAFYRTPDLPGANLLKAAHAAVLAAYGFDPKQDLLAQLLALNLAVLTARGEPAAAPGLPRAFPWCLGIRVPLLHRPRPIYCPGGGMDDTRGRVGRVCPQRAANHSRPPDGALRTDAPYP